MRRVMWGVVGLVALALTFGLAVGSNGSGQRPEASDRGFTEAYLRSRFALEQARDARLAASERAVGRLVADLSTECPGIMTGAPRDEEFATLARERLVILALAVLRFSTGPSTTYAHILGGVHWSNGQLTRLVHAWLGEEAANSKLVAPDPCVDMGAWARNGYHRLSPSTTRFLERSDAIDNITRAEKRRLRVPPATKTGKVVLELLEPYEAPKDVVLARRVKRLEAWLFASNLAIVARGASELSRALGAS